MVSQHDNDSSAALPLTRVAVGVVAYNEHDALLCVLDDILAQDYPHELIEVFLIDSASTDDTRSIMTSFAQRQHDAGYGFASVEVLDNPKRIIPAGWNVALRAFLASPCVSQIFLRIDGHARIPHDFISMNVAVQNEGEYVSGGPRPAIAYPDTPWTRTLLLAEESAFGSSVADYRSSATKEYTKAVFLPAFRRAVIEQVGFYDERLLRTEDNDFCYRIREAGFRIRFDGRIHSAQAARNTLRGMLKQKYGNGYWVGRTALLKPACLQPYHFAPLTLVLGAVITLGVAAAGFWQLFVGCALLYMALCLALALRSIVQAKHFVIPAVALPFLFPAIHISYGAGTFVGLIRGLFSNNDSSVQEDSIEISNDKKEKR